MSGKSQVKAASCFFFFKDIYFMFYITFLQHKVQGKELPGHCRNSAHCGPRGRLLQENLHQARVLPEPVWTSHGSGALLRELLCPHQDQIQ